MDARDHHGNTAAAVGRMAGAPASLIDFLESDGGAQTLKWLLAQGDWQQKAQELMEADEANSKVKRVKHARRKLIRRRKRKRVLPPSCPQRLAGASKSLVV